MSNYNNVKSKYVNARKRRGDSKNRFYMNTLFGKLINMWREYVRGENFVVKIATKCYKVGLYRNHDRNYCVL